MDNPPAEIADAINACAAAANPDSQIEAFNNYFTPDASFIHPACYVPSAPDSLKRVIGIYIFYRIAIPHTAFTIQSVGWDEDSGKLFVDLIQHPWMRGTTWITGWRPTIEMHVHLWLRKNDEGKWRIYKQEDTIQPFTFMLAFPGISYIGQALFWICQHAGLLGAYIFTTLGFWQPRQDWTKLKTG